MRDPDRVEGVRLVTDRPGYRALVGPLVDGSPLALKEENDRLKAENADLRQRLNALIDVEEGR